MPRRGCDSQDQVEATEFGGQGERIVRVNSTCRDFSHSASQSKGRLWSDTQLLYYIGFARTGTPYKGRVHDVEDTPTRGYCARRVA